MVKAQSAKAKGRRLQQWVRDRILEVFPGLEPDDVKSTSMGAGGEDVQLSPAARKQIPISVECKSRKKHAVYKTFEQAVSNAPDGMEPVLIIKQDYKAPLAVIDAKFFFRMMGKAK